MRKISSSPSLHGPLTTDLEYAERVQHVFENEDSGLSVLHPKVKCTADESVLWVVKRHLKLMTLSYVQAGFSLAEMLHHISILKETQNASKPAILIDCTQLPVKGFLNNPFSLRNDEPCHCRDENIYIHFAYPSLRSHSAAMETLGQLTDFKVLHTQIFRRNRQGPALGIARIQCDPDEVTKFCTRGLQNAWPKFVQSLLRLLKAGSRQAKNTNQQLDGGYSRGRTKSSACEPFSEESASTTVFNPDVVADCKNFRVPQPNLDLCFRELQSEVFTKYTGQASGLPDHQDDASENCLVVKAKDLNLEHEVGLGSSGLVYAGLYKEQLKVAVKILKVLPGLPEDFRREVLALSLGRHKNIVPLVGTCLDSRLGICIVTELMEGGSLRDYLQRMKKLQTQEALRLAGDIAEGMQFLHSRGIIHMDLKTPNIFLDKEGTAVIGDLGSARFSHDNNEVRKDIGTYRWMAPEVLGDEAGNTVATPKSDVYSFGVLLWELVSCEVPFAEYNPVQAAVGVLTTGLRPTIPKDCFPPLKCLMQKCWSQKPVDRPSFSQILKMLKIISVHRPRS